MSYSIYIGEAEISYSNSEGDAFVSVEAKGETNVMAPEFGYGDISGKGNGRHPGYGQMADFCRQTGLYNLFFDNDEGILRHHPGCVPLEKRHLNEVVAAREKWYKEHTGCVKKLPYKTTEPENLKEMSWTERERYEKEQDFDWIYARLIWYEFWFRHALKNCKKPVISNY